MYLYKRTVSMGQDISPRNSKPVTNTAPKGKFCLRKELFIIVNSMVQRDFFSHFSF